MVTTSSFKVMMMSQWRQCVSLIGVIWCSRLYFTSGKTTQQEKVIEYLESTMVTLVLDILICWKWVAPTTNKYCYFNLILTCSVIMGENAICNVWNLRYTKDCTELYHIRLKFLAISGSVYEIRHSYILNFDVSSMNFQIYSFVFRIIAVTLSLVKVTGYS